MVFNEESILRESLETEHKTRGEAPDSLAFSQVKGLSSQITLKCLMGQMRTPQIQMETSRRSLSRNLDRGGGQTEFWCHQQDISRKMIMSYSH